MTPLRFMNAHFLLAVMPSALLHALQRQAR
jgi:hypothetical protein